MLKQLTTARGALQHLIVKHPRLENKSKRLQQVLCDSCQRWAVQLELPASVKQLAMGAEAYEPMDIEEVPAVVTNNPVW